MEVRNVTKSDFEPMNMQEYFYAYPSNDRRQKMFSGFHGTMKFLHGNGYVSENMHPSMIIVLDEEAKHIRIVRIAKMPDDMDMAERKRLVQEDIKNAVIVQIGLFTGTLPYLRGNRDDILNFFKEQFDEIAYHQRLDSFLDSVRIFFFFYSSKRVVDKIQSITKLCAV